MRTLPQLSEQEYTDLISIINCHFEIGKAEERANKLVRKIKRDTIQFSYPYRCDKDNPDSPSYKLRVTPPQLNQAEYNHLCDAIRNPLQVIQSSMYNLQEDVSPISVADEDKINVILEQVIRIDDYIKTLKEGEHG